MEYLITIDLGKLGVVLRWTVSTEESGVVESWVRSGEETTKEKVSNTWTVEEATYMVMRDVLRFMLNDDWRPGSLI